MPLRNLITLFAAVLDLTLSGCISVQPTPAQMLAETAGFQLPHQPGAGMAVVYVVFGRNTPSSRWRSMCSSIASSRRLRWGATGAGSISISS